MTYRCGNRRVPFWTPAPALADEEFPRRSVIMTIQQMMSRLPKKAGARFFVATPDK
jgi:hypothetical protein